jgi:hypothetical protein
MTCGAWLSRLCASHYTGNSKPAIYFWNIDSKIARLQPVRAGLSDPGEGPSAAMWQAVVVTQSNDVSRVARSRWGALMVRSPGADLQQAVRSLPVLATGQENGAAARCREGIQALLKRGPRDRQKFSRGSPISRVITGSRTGLVGMRRTKGSNVLTLSYQIHRIPLRRGVGVEHGNEVTRRERTRPPRPAVTLARDLAVKVRRRAISGCEWCPAGLGLSDSEPVDLIEDPQGRAGAL